MRKLVITALLALAATSASWAAQTVHKVQLPCESQNQELSPTGAQLTAFCKDRSVHLVAIPSGVERTLVQADRGASRAVFSPDGKRLAIGLNDGTVTVLATTDGQALTKEWKAGTRRIDTLYFFPDGKHLFVGPVDSPGTVWDIAGEPALRATLTVDFGGILACAVSPDGKLLVAAGDDTVLRWYDTVSWKKIAENRDFLLETFALQFTPDGKFLLAGGADSHLTMLDAATGNQVRQLNPNPGSYIVDIELLDGKQRVLTVYLDDAGRKPPHTLIWDLATTKSMALEMVAHPTCGGVVSGKLWLCSTEENNVTISRYE